MCDEINGVKIQRLPTVGKPLSMKRFRDRPTYANISVNKKEAQLIKEISKELSRKGDNGNGKPTDTSSN